MNANKQSFSSTASAGQVSTWRRITAQITAAFLIVQPVLASAQVVADPGAGAQRPAVDAAANGVPVVQITAPTASGVSRNQYQQFNVAPQGLILNNSASIVQTQQAGWIEGNRNLSGGSARVILNEVTSSHPSLLRGHTEVAGSRAEVVIANPNGITCDGCGFINTTRNVLTTGTPQFGGDGSLQAYRVTGGNISIQGAGLAATNADQVDLIARSINLNAGLWANRLNLVAGSNEVQHGDLFTRAIAGEGAQPGVSIDVGALGGMYANKIRLVGTEAGLGVTNAGNISALDGNLEIDAHGRVSIAGKASATGDLHITSAQGIHNSGTLYAQQQTRLDTAGALTNSQNALIGAQGKLTIQSAGLDSQGAISAGLQAEGNKVAAATPGDLHITSRGDAKLAGNTAATGNITLTGGQNVTQHGTLYAQQGATLNATGTLTNTGLIAAQSHLGVDATNIESSGTLMAGLRPDNSTAASGDLSLTARNTATLSGQQLAAGKLQASARELAMAGSSNVANGDLSLTASAGQINLTAANLDAGGSATLNATGAVLHQQARTTATSTHISAASLDNRQGQIAATGSLGNSQITLAGELNNADGSLSARNADFALSAARIDNTRGSLQHAGNGTLSLAATDLANTQGAIASNGQLSLQAATLANQEGSVAAAGDASVRLTGNLDNQRGELVSYANLDVNAQGSAGNQAGRIEARGATSSLSLTAQAIDNADGRIVNQGPGDTRITSQTTLANSNASGQDGKGIIGGNGMLAITAAALSNAQNGQVVAGDAITLQISGAAQNSARIEGKAVTLRSAALDNAAGQIASDLDLNLNAASITHLGLLSAGQDLHITTAGGLANAAGNIVKANRDLSLQVGGSINNAGEFSAVRKASVTAAALDNQASGQILGQHVQASTTGRLDNAGRLQGQTVDLTADTLANTSLITGVDLTARTTNLENRGPAAVIAAADLLDLQVKDTLTNIDGANLYSANTLQISADGQLDANGLPINSSKAVRNSSASIQAEGELVVAADQISNERTVVNVGWSEERAGAPVTEVAAHQTGDAEHVNYVRYTPFYKTEQVLAGTTPAARIVSGGNMWLTGSILNAQSTIAAGRSLFMDVDRLALAPRNLQEIERRTGSADEWQWVKTGKKCNWAGTGCYDIYGWVNHPYDYAQAKPYGHDTTTLAATATANASISINAQDVTIQTVGAGTTPGLTSATLGATQSGNPARSTGAGATPVAPAPQSIPGFSVPAGALYTVRTEPGQRYLVETDPRFASYTNFISSDYMFSRLGINPEGAQKRFGDGFYEQQLVLDQILQLTGRRYLGQFASAEDQFKDLMESGIASAAAFGITPGIKLSGEQVASLTHDIVWLEEREVSVAGKPEKVLVPVVYLTRLQADDLQPSGALIAANDVVVRATDSIHNSGTIRSNTRTAVLGNRITNEGGVISSQGHTLVEAEEDLINRSARISGSSVQLSAGRDLQIGRVAPAAVQLGAVSTTRIHEASDITATERLDVSAGRDLSVTASTLASEGRLVLDAGRNLSVQQQTASERVTNATGELARTAQLTSQLKAGATSSCSLATNSASPRPTCRPAIAQPSSLVATSRLAPPPLSKATVSMQATATATAASPKPPLAPASRLLVTSTCKPVPAQPGRAQPPRPTPPPNTSPCKAPACKARRAMSPCKPAAASPSPKPVSGTKAKSPPPPAAKASSPAAAPAPTTWSRSTKPSPAASVGRTLRSRPGKTSPCAAPRSLPSETSSPPQRAASAAKKPATSSRKSTASPAAPKASASTCARVRSPTTAHA